MKLKKSLIHLLDSSLVVTSLLCSERKEMIQFMNILVIMELFILRMLLHS